MTYEQWKTQDNKAKRQAVAIIAILVGFIVATANCADSPTEPPCDENHPNWPDCHEQGSGNGGQ